MLNAFKKLFCGRKGAFTLFKSDMYITEAFSELQISYNTRSTNSSEALYSYIRLAFYPSLILSGNRQQLDILQISQHTENIQLACTCFFSFPLCNIYLKINLKNLSTNGNSSNSDMLWSSTEIFVIIISLDNCYLAILSRKQVAVCPYG